MKDEEVIGLRAALDMNPDEFASLCGVDGRTVRRWEKGECAPVGAALQVILAFEEMREKNPERWAKVQEIAARAVRVGGLSFLLLTLFDRAFHRD